MFNEHKLKEEDRQKAVQQYSNYFHIKQQELQDMVILASQLCEVPNAFIALIDQETLLFKASVGISFGESLHEASFCIHAIENDKVAHITDCLEHPLFATLATVSEYPNIRFYASANLKTHQGYVIGTICVFDIKPKSLSVKQLDSLQAIARQVSHLIALEHNLQTLHERIEEVQRQKFEIETTRMMLSAILDSSNTQQILISRKHSILAFNKGIAEYFKRVTGKELKKGSSILDYIPEKFSEGFINLFAKSFAGETIKMDHLLQLADETPNWWQITVTPTRGTTGEIIGVSFHSIDIHEKKTYDEKVRLQNNHLREIAFIQSHEVRSPLASILGLIALLKSEDGVERKEYLDLLEIAARQLDERIGKIVNLTHEE